MTDIGIIERDDLRSIPTYRAAYSDRTALLMAKLAHRAYEPFDTDDNAWTVFNDAICGVGFGGCSGLIDRKNGTAGYVAEHDDLIVIAFRGTENRLDWRTNVNARFIALQGGTRVHTGFFQAYWPIRDKLFEFVIAALGKKPRPVYITGHSLGGALALMATAELANHQEAAVRDSIAACYTFGCPRAGDRSFDLYVKVPLYRITNGVDIVPEVPPAILGYRHVGDTRYFGKLGVAPLRRSPSTVQKGWRSARGVTELFKSFTLLNVADHSMKVYIAKLAAWAEQQRKEAQARRAVTVDPKITTGPA